tara:strand:- start:4019 stop:4810 length:792 start_codon:yes stop_codon:yes gene_type:complete
MGVNVPGLRQKFKLLVTYGVYNSIDEIADKLGKRPKTILSWADGTPSVDPDSVPNRSFQAFARIFADAIGVDADDPKVSDLLLAPPSWLEAELRQRSGISFRKLLEDEAEKSAFEMERYPTESMMIRTVLIPPPSADHRAWLGEFFRLVLKRDLRRYNVFALQYTNAQWGPVPFTLKPETGNLHLPGFQPDRKHAYMQELSDEGLSLFAVVACRQELPEVLQIHAAEETALDTSSLSALVDVLHKSTRADRRFFTVSVHFDRG